MDADKRPALMWFNTSTRAVCCCFMSLTSPSCFTVILSIRLDVYFKFSKTNIYDDSGLYEKNVYYSKSKKEIVNSEVERI